MLPTEMCNTIRWERVMSFYGPKARPHPANVLLSKYGTRHGAVYAGVGFFRRFLKAYTNVERLCFCLLGQSERRSVTVVTGILLSHR